MNPSDEFHVTFPQLLRLTSERYWQGVGCGLCLFAAAIGLWSALDFGTSAGSSVPPSTPPSLPVAAPGPMPAPQPSPEPGHDLTSLPPVEEGDAEGHASGPQPITLPQAAAEASPTDWSPSDQRPGTPIHPADLDRLTRGR